jgi:hypothetical protein
MPTTFDAATLATLSDSKEVRIHTGARKGRGVVIWIVVVDDAVFVRSVRGPTGKWYVAAAADRQAALEAGGRRVPVRITPVTDDATIEAVSQAYQTKYATSPYAKAMTAADTLPTTLRLDPM